MAYTNRSYTMSDMSSHVSSPKYHGDGQFNAVNYSGGLSVGYPPTVQPTGGMAPHVMILQPNSKTRLQSRLDGVLAISAFICLSTNVIFGAIAIFIASKNIT